MDTRTIIQQIEVSKTISGVYDALDRAGIVTAYNLRFVMRLVRAECNQDKIRIVKSAQDRIKQIENLEV